MCDLGSLGEACVLERRGGLMQCQARGGWEAEVRPGELSHQDRSLGKRKQRQGINLTGRRLAKKQKEDQAEAQLF